MRLAVLIAVALVVALSGCAGEARNAGCSEVDHSFARASVATANIDFIGAETPDDLYAATVAFIHEVNSDDDRCLSDSERAAAFAKARSSIGADCQACRDELDRAEG
jgi:hypothetical protein